jgi:hypothetical protein
MEQTAIDVFLPVMESSVVFAAHYAQACGRDCVTSQDICYGMMYAARNITGKQIGSLFPEVYTQEDSDENEEAEEDSDEEEAEAGWTRYSGSGTDEQALQMNACADSWDAWDPESPAERALKNAVNKAKEEYV